MRTVIRKAGSRAGRWAGLAAGLTLAGLAAGQALKGFRYPEYDEQGLLKYEVVGDEAQIAPDGLIAIKNLKLTFYEGGKLVMEMTTPHCLFDRTRRAASSTADVWVARREIEVTGRGFEWEGQEGRMNIQSNARVVLKALSVRPAVERGGK